MGLDGLDTNIERFVRLSERGNVYIMLPQNRINYELSPGAIGRIKYYNKGSNVPSNYGTLFIKEVTDCDGSIIEPESYVFQGRREIKLGVFEKEGMSKAYGEIILRTEDVPSADNLKLLIEFM
ncbi:MAG: hypothetical protein KAI18_03030 [Candidatus Aenigmarchaeota archaeon]|nr:hypothetical protein [Candidatus Aenigmarchaeota archaeon]